MSWINVASNRWADLTIIRHRLSIDRMVRRDVCDLSFRLLRIKKPERLLTFEQKIHECADSVLTNLRQPESLGQHIASETTIGLLILSTLLGIDRSAGLKRLLMFEVAANAGGRARIAVLRRLFEPCRRRMPNKPLSSFSKSENAFYRYIDALPTADALDVCNSPFSPNYGWAEGLILPLAYALTVEQDSDPSLNRISELLAYGAHPERRGQLLFDCSVEPPSEPNTGDDNDPSTWYPFSAVELKDGQLIAYLWVGFMEGKLDFNDKSGPNAFWMLAPEQVERAWKLVNEYVSKDTWEAIEGEIASNCVKYIMVVDTTLVEVGSWGVCRAAESFGIDLTVKHVFDV